MEIYLHTKFQLDISICAWNKYTSGFGQRPATILEFYFWFHSWHKFRHRRSSAFHSASAYQISSKSNYLGRSYDIISIFHGSSAILYLIWVILDHPRSVIFGFSLIPQIWSCCRDISTFVFRRLGLKLAIHAHLGVLGPLIPPRCGHPSF